MGMVQGHSKCPEPKFMKREEVPELSRNGAALGPEPAESDSYYHHEPGERQVKRHFTD